MELAELATLVVCMTSCAAFDLRQRRIPNALNVVVATCGIAAAAATSAATAGLALAGGALLFVVLYAAWQRRWLGGGDVKLGAAIGTWLGPLHGLYALVLGVALGAVLAVVVLARGGRALRSEVKTNLTIALYTRELGGIGPRPDSATIPLGAALAAAAVAIRLVYGGGSHAAW